MSEFVSVLLPFIGIFVLAVAEYLLARAWTPAYFRYGLPFFRMRLHGVRLDAETERRLDSVAVHRASVLVFRRLSDTDIAFRESGKAAPGFRYTPILHGLLRYDREEGATYVIGWINLFAAAAIALIAWILFSSSRWHRPWVLTVWFALIFGVMYGIGAWRYRMVGKALRREP